MRPLDPAFPRLSLDDCEVNNLPGSVSLVTWSIGVDAVARCVAESGCDPDAVRATRCHGRLLTRQDVWELVGVDEWERRWEPPFYDDDAEPPDAPEWAPDGWEPDLDDPAWERCEASHPSAEAIWIVEIIA